MDSPISVCEQSFRFLELPTELRDHIYELAVIELPLPNLDSSLAYIQNASIRPTKPKLNWQRLHTSILLTNRQIFEEAYNTVLRRAQLVQITTRSLHLRLSIRQVLAMTQIAVLPVKYRSFCALRHEMREGQAAQQATYESRDYIICKRDIDTFCLGLMGEFHYFLSKRIPSTTIHSLTFLSPNDGLSGGLPASLTSTEIQKRYLDPYQTNLRKIKNISVGAVLSHHVDQDLAQAVSQSIASEANLDPQKFHSELICLRDLVEKHSSEGDETRALLLGTKCLQKFHIIISGKHWTVMAASGGEGYAESIAEISYQILGGYITSATEGIRTTLRNGPAASHRTGLVKILQVAYAMSVHISKGLGVPGWKPDTEQEAQLSYKVAIGLRLGSSVLSGPLGYLAMRRAYELAPRDVDVQLEKLAYLSEAESISAEGWDDFDENYLLESGLQSWGVGNA